MSHNIGKSEKAEMYLKAILLIGQESPPVTTSKVADFLDLSLPSVSEMLKRMEQQQLVAHVTDGVELASTGKRRALQLIRRMRLAETLLHSMLNVPLDEIYDEACRWEHALSERVEEHIDRALGQPAYCPHGHPIPDAAGAIGSLTARPLLDLESGARARVTAVPERQPELLQYLSQIGLLPGTELKVTGLAPLDGPLFIHVGEQQQALGRQTATAILVQVA